MSTPLTRRRFFAIAATLAAGVGIPFAISRKTNQQTHSASPNQEEQPVIWRGIALGSGAELRLFGVERKQAEILVNKVLAEVSRLEKIFSLYRDDSLISRLNREGRLKNPPSDFLQLLDFDTKEIRFAQKGMGLSLNGIAQGYITDKVVELLKQQGVTQALIDMGEIYGFDNANRREWNVSIRNPDQEDQILTTIAMKNQAFATSGGYGTVMDEAAKFTHLFDPRTGGSQPRYKSMSVMAESAAVADAFSTAFSIMDEAAIRTAAQVKKAQVWLVMPNNELKKIGS